MLILNPFRLPGQEGFTCPCAGEGAINVDAYAYDPGGEVLLSELTADGTLPAGSLANTCLAVRGRLVINQNYTIQGGEMRMQPGRRLR